jgi:hypothetical protein
VEGTVVLHDDKPLASFYCIVVGAQANLPHSSDEAAEAECKAALKRHVHSEKNTLYRVLVRFVNMRTSWGGSRMGEQARP